MRKPAKRTTRDRINDVRLLAIAYHEAGHAVIAHAFGTRPKLATIIPHKDSLGRVEHRSPLRGIRLDLDGSDRARLRAERAIMICLAGPIAHRRHNPKAWRRTDGAGDEQLAGDLAIRVCGSDEQATAFLLWLGVTARDMVEAHWSEIERMAAALIERKTLRGPNIITAIRPPVEHASIRIRDATDQSAAAGPDEV